MVLADRYIYTLMVRDLVRARTAMVKDLYGIALVRTRCSISTSPRRRWSSAPSPRTAPWTTGRAGWTWPLARHVRQLPQVSSPRAGTVQAPAGHLRLHHRRWRTLVEDISAELQRKIESTLAGR